MLKHVTDLEVRVREFGRSVANRTEGASAVEYGLLVALIAVVIIIAVALLGRNLSGNFNRVASSVAAT
jgi:pilus assembly protein Flp/PilA